MSHSELTLRPFYAGWENYEDLLTQAIGPLSADQLAIQAAPTLRPAWELAAHIIAARVYWFHRVLGEGEATLAPLQTWDDPGMPPRGAAELVDGLTTTFALIQGCLDRWTPAMLADPAVTPRGWATTRQWVIWHVIEHDLHHGGELFFTLGMHGLPTPDL
jgi:uncharacterized damage-inducible protein DinB